jgi:hypothetical protein
VNPLPSRYGVVTDFPPASVNAPGSVLAGSNGAAHFASRYSAEVSTQPTPVSMPGVTSLLMCPRVSAEIVWLTWLAALAGLVRNGAG